MTTIAPKMVTALGRDTTKPLAQLVPDTLYAGVSTYGDSSYGLNTYGAIASISARDTGFINVSMVDLDRVVKLYPTEITYPTTLGYGGVPTVLQANGLTFFADYNRSALSGSNVVSTDGGLTFSLRELNGISTYTRNFVQAVYGGGVYLLLDNNANGTVRRSADGITWTTVNTDGGAGGAGTYSATYSSGKWFVADDYGNGLSVSIDGGVTFAYDHNAILSGSIRHLMVASNGTGTLVAVDKIGIGPQSAYRSIDNAVTWTEVTIPAPALAASGYHESVLKLDFFSGVFIRVLGSIHPYDNPKLRNLITISKDLGATWESVALPKGMVTGSYYVDSAGEVGGMYLIKLLRESGTVFLWSNDGISWDWFLVPLNNNVSLYVIGSTLYVMAEVYPGDGSQDGISVYEAPNLFPPTGSSIKMRMIVGAVAPASPVLLDVWVDTTAGTVMKHWNGTSWV